VLVGICIERLRWWWGCLASSKLAGRVPLDRVSPRALGFHVGRYPDQGTAYSGAVSGVSDLTPSASSAWTRTGRQSLPRARRRTNWVTPDNPAYVIYSGSTGSLGCCSSPSCEPLGAQHKLRQLRAKDVVALSRTVPSTPPHSRFGSTTSLGFRG